VALLVSYWLKAFSHGFFIFNQPMKTFGGPLKNVGSAGLQQCLALSKYIHCSLRIAEKVAKTLWAYKEWV
jgi:hypothetical protein